MVKAVLRAGFERSDLYSLKCLTAKTVWFEGASKYCSSNEDVDPGVFESGDANPYTGSTVGLVAVGTFHGGGNHGHWNAYDYKFVARCIERAERLLDNSSSVPSVLPIEERSKIEAWEAGG
jgi:hypothetical protein